MPGISVLVTLYGFVADPRHLSGQLQPVLNVLPAAGAAIVVEQVTRLAEKSANALSLYLLVSLSIAGWSANAGIKAMFDALNVIYDEQEKRSFIRLNLLSLTATVSGILLLILILFTVAILPALLSSTPYQTVLEQIVWVVRWPAFFAIAIIALGILYKVGPADVRLGSSGCCPAHRSRRLPGSERPIFSAGMSRRSPITPRPTARSRPLSCS